MINSTRVESLWLTVDRYGKGRGKPWPLKVCVCVCVFLQNLAMLFESIYVPFCYRSLPLPHPPFASWPEQLISCPLAHDQPFPWIFFKPVNPVGSYAPFCNRPLPLPAPFNQLAWWQTHTFIHTHTHLASKPNFSFLGQKQPKSVECLWTNCPTWSQQKLNHYLSLFWLLIENSFFCKPNNELLINRDPPWYQDGNRQVPAPYWGGKSET